MKKIKVGLYIVFALIMIATHIAHAQAEGVYRDLSFDRTISDDPSLGEIKDYFEVAIKDASSDETQVKIKTKISEGKAIWRSAAKENYTLHNYKMHTGMTNTGFKAAQTKDAVVISLPINKLDWFLERNTLTQDLWKSLIQDLTKDLMKDQTDDKNKLTEALFNQKILQAKINQFMTLSNQPQNDVTRSEVDANQSQTETIVQSVRNEFKDLGSKLVPSAVVLHLSVRLSFALRKWLEAKVPAKYNERLKYFTEGSGTFLLACSPYITYTFYKHQLNNVQKSNVNLDYFCGSIAMASTTSNLKPQIMKYANVPLFGVGLLWGDHFDFYFNAAAFAGYAGDFNLYGDKQATGLKNRGTNLRFGAFYTPKKEYDAKYENYTINGKTVPYLIIGWQDVDHFTKVNKGKNTSHLNFGISLGLGEGNFFANMSQSVLKLWSETHAWVMKFFN